MNSGRCPYGPFWHPDGPTEAWDLPVAAGIVFRDWWRTRGWSIVSRGRRTPVVRGTRSLVVCACVGRLADEGVPDGMRLVVGVVVPLMRNQDTAQKTGRIGRPGQPHAAVVDGPSYRIISPVPATHATSSRILFTTAMLKWERGSISNCPQLWCVGPKSSPVSSISYARKYGDENILRKTDLSPLVSISVNGFKSERGVLVWRVKSQSWPPTPVN